MTRNGWKLSIIAAAVSVALGAQAQQSQEQQSQKNPQSQSAQQRSQSAQPQQEQSSQAQRSQGDQSQSQARQGSGAQQQGDQKSKQSSSGQSSGSMPFDKLAQQHSNLSDFANAVKTAGLADSLDDGPRYTIFAPTNKAFDAKQGKSIDDLMKPENHQDLVQLLRAHIVADNLDLATARELPAAKTIDGGQVDLRTQNGTLMIGDAKLVDKNPIEMGNIRVFPIDGVLARNTSGGSSPQASNSGDSSQNKD